MPYEPTPESVRQHPVPDWFHDAKLGIFVHWGLYSVPAWAPLTGELDKVVSERGWEHWFAHNPYAEWYANSMKIEGSPTRQHHARAYGADFPYHAFAATFNGGLARWNPDTWAALFAEVGARYVVLTTKHHDGFLLWPSRTPNPFIEDYFAARDLVGDLAESVCAHGMRMGLYYSGGLDWTFLGEPICDLPSLVAAVPQQPEYIAYADAHWRELIDRYQPSVLWNDIGYPFAANVDALFADYYNTLPDGVVNDRFSMPPGAGNRHFDFTTPEYAVYDDIQPHKWESTRGIGFSFGYNQNEDARAFLSVEELVHSFVDIVSKNGNLLLNIGPMADGTLPEGQRERLRGLGAWLQVNGEAIFGTRPWARAEGDAGEGIGVRFTQKGDALYVIVLGAPAGSQVSIASLAVDANAVVTLLGYDGALAWAQDGARLTVTLPGSLPEAPAYSLRITPKPRS